MRIAILALMIVASAIAIACGGSAETPTTPVAPQPTATVAATAAQAQTVATAATSVAAATAALVQIEMCADETAVDCALEVSVGPELEDCVGSAPMRCMVVDGELFYEQIEGFTHEAGYRYRIRMERYDPWYGGVVPADASKYGYRLIEVVEKVRAGQ